jgi:hypothetical protein
MWSEKDVRYSAAQGMTKDQNFHVSKRYTSVGQGVMEDRSK